MALPPGFVIDQQPQQPSGLPPGFVPDEASGEIASAPQQPSGGTAPWQRVPNLLRKIHSFTEPIAEGVGAVAGGLLASPGVVTTPLGVGLGAGIGKTAENALMSSLGLPDNRSAMNIAADAANTVALNAVAPAVIEKVARLGFSGLKFVGGILGDIGNTVAVSMGSGQSVDKAVREVLSRLSGGQLSQVVQALRKTEEHAGAPASAAEGIAQANMTGNRPLFGDQLVKFQQELAQHPTAGIPLRQLAEEQQAAMVTPMQRMAGGATTQAQDAAQTAAAARRDTVTEPLRTNALNRANVAGVVAPQIEGEIAGLQASRLNALRNEGQLRTEAANVDRLAPGQPREPVTQSTGNYPDATVPYAGAYPRANGRGGWNFSTQRTVSAKVETEAGRQAHAAANEFKAFEVEARKDIGLLRDQLTRMEQAGLKPLRADDVLSSIDRQMSTVGDNERDLVQTALQYAKERIGRIPKSANGHVDAKSLYAARKDINERIRNYLVANPASDKKLAAGADIAIKKRIDDAIDGAGGIGWKNYLSTYAKMSESIDRLKVAQRLTQKLTNEQGRVTAPQFMGAMGRGEEAMLKQSTGVPRYESVDELFEGQDLSHIRGVGNQLARQEKVNSMAGKISGTNALAGKTPEIPHFMSRTASVTNFLMRHLASDANEKIAAETARRLTNPKNLADFLDGKGPYSIASSKWKLTPEQRSALVDKLRVYAEVGSRTVAPIADINALTR